MHDPIPLDKPKWNSTSTAVHNRTNDWMDTHVFQEGFKVQYFCLTLVGDTRLWYESLRPINVGWIGLQNQLRQQYSKICNTREQ